MSATEKQVKMAARMYEWRDKAKRILGDKYKAKMAEIGKMLTAIAAREGKEPLAMAIDLCKTRPGLDSVLIIAAVVEMTEPSHP